MRSWFVMAACVTLALPAGAQESEDANLRHPQLMSVAGEDSQTQFVVGDAAWGDVVVTLAALRRADPATGPAIAGQLWERRDTNAPVFLFEVARLTAASDPDRALEAYFLARARTIYDASRCVDPTVLPVITIASEQAGTAVAELMQNDPARLETALQRVIESGETFTSQVSPWWACSFGEAAYSAAVNQADMPGAQWLKGESIWPDLRSAIDENMRANLVMLREGQQTSAQ